MRIDLDDLRIYNPEKERKNRVLYALGAVALAVISLIGGGECANRYEYSSGTRTGMINKISKKGLFWKTFEGQMALEGIVSGGGQSGANVWDFSIDGSERQGENEYLLAKKAEEALQTGSKVRIKYHQPLWTWPWRGSTSYFIQSIEPMDTGIVKEDTKKEESSKKW